MFKASAYIDNVLSDILIIVLLISLLGVTSNPGSVFDLDSEMTELIELTEVESDTQYDDRSTDLEDIEIFSFSSHMPYAWTCMKRIILSGGSLFVHDSLYGFIWSPPE